MILLAALLWVLYSILEGTRDGVMYHLRDMAIKVHFNEHIVFSTQRAIVLTLCAVIAPKLLVFCPLVFSFLHNGAYYTTRELLQKGTYPKYWFDQSNTSSAWTTKFFNVITRTLLFIVGLIWLICIIFYL